MRIYGFTCSRLYKNQIFLYTDTKILIFDLGVYDMFDFEKAITRCVNNYNISREEAERIIKTPNEDLTVAELRYKYDNMQLGVSFPDWITPENLMSMCYSVVKTYNYNGYYWYYGADELSTDLFIWATIRLNKWDNHNLVRKALCDQCKTIMRDLIRQQHPNLVSTSLYVHINAEVDSKYSQTTTETIKNR